MFFSFLFLLGSLASCEKDDLEGKIKESEDMTTIYFMTQDSKNLDVVIKTNQKEQEIYWFEAGKKQTVIIPDDGVLNLPSNTELRVLNNIVDELSCTTPSLIGFDVDSLVSLKVLDLSNSGITEMKVSKSVNLQSLNCSSTPIISLDLTSNTNLKELDCSHTSVATLDISENIALTKLNISETNITTLDMSKNVGLIDFISQNAAFEELTFTENIKLENIDIENSAALTMLDLSGLENIKTLACANLEKIEKILYAATDISTVPAIIKDNSVIQEYCAIDGKCRLSLNSVSNYYFEDGEWKNVRDIPASMNITNLRSYGRPITLISLVDNIVIDNEGVETKLPADEEVELYIPGKGYIVVDNAKVLQKIQYTWNDVEELDVTNCYALEHLDCGDTKIKKIDLTNCTKLKYFSASLCYGLTELDLTQCPELTVANCGQTSISTINLSNNTKLEEFSCQNTQIETLDLSANINLKQLRFGRSKITAIDCSMLINLEFLHADKIGLTNLDLTNCTKLKELYCLETDVNSLDLSKCVDLEKLYCDNNDLLATINVSGCSSLLEISCSNTKLSSLNLADVTALESLSFSDTPNLKSLDLSTNVNLTHLDGSSSSLTSLDLSSCPLITYLSISYSEMEELNLSNCNSSLYLSCYSMPNISKIIYNAASIDEVSSKVLDKGSIQDYCFEDQTCRLYINDTDKFYFKYTGKHPDYGYDIGEWFKE
ncbi:hypothetical protein EO244_11600 [Ancylomarina salipaludis]|uniref:Leucine-rich repeat domain-containing protein n=1 Tax=Ancylomarina salipaludis TaxID=2501299 RepID=A0A4V1MZZ2_9BACT|nr:hypothetical protein [Ancylomarina salipaludis]RXQ92187.1 hypothetical protein EO244_11600 [Ancylomarina salipaludis]